MTSLAARKPAFDGWWVHHRRFTLITLAALLIVAMTAFWAWNRNAERRALARMPPDQRAALFEQTRVTTTALCDRAAVDGALRDRCIASAEFMSAFPECDDACQTYVKQFTAQPAR
jgi:hypothetical protein